MSKIYEIEGVNWPPVCQKCVVCIRMRLMEMGFVKGQRIEVSDKKYGLYLINFLTDSGKISQTIGVRQDELDELCLKS